MILIDSNIIIYAARPEHEPLRQLISTEDAAVSVLSRIEVLGYHRLLPTERSLLERLFDSLLVLPISDEVADRAIALRQQQRISLGDSVIAATALVAGLRLVTHNTSDFERIDGLELDDPLAGS